MNLLDMRTVIAGYALSNVVSLVVMLALFLRYRGRFAGLGFWLADFILQSASLGLLVLRGIVPETISIAFGSPLVIIGTAFLCRGLEKFVGQSGPRWLYFVFPPAYIVVHELFAFAWPNLAARDILFSMALIFICTRCAWLLLKGSSRVFRRMTTGAGFVLAAFSLVSAVRVVIEMLVPPGADFFRANVYITIVLLVYQMLFIGLTFTLVLMVNERLFAVFENDLAGRDQAERVIRLRLRLWEYAAAHSVSELMQKALDEIELLTDSAIGFYHFVDEERGALSLQAWSTRTRAEYCKAEGEGMHYPIGQAGVWVDCLRERRPVMHNDYASLPHRKGLPAGHAPLIRELVVPTLRQERVVSILGVGNKATAYEEKDVVLVSYIADLIWSIVTQKRADEVIHTLNERLERLAMTDDLTSLANRRSFFSQAQEAIKRGRRYHQPLSCIMADIDHFKNINDTFGHDAGDEALKAMARVLLETVRTVDLVARLGGEEFGVLLPNTKMEDALVLAERLRIAIEDKVSHGRFGETKVTASFGVATLREGIEDIDALLHNADVAMYQAKLHGRNQVFRFE